MKKILLLLLICSFVLPLVACGGPKETTTYPITSVSKDGNSYTFEYIDGEKTKKMTITPTAKTNALNAVVQMHIHIIPTVKDTFCF